MSRDGKNRALSWGELWAGIGNRNILETATALPETLAKSFTDLFQEEEAAAAQAESELLVNQNSTNLPSDFKKPESVDDKTIEKGMGLERAPATLQEEGLKKQSSFFDSALNETSTAISSFANQFGIDGLFSRSTYPEISKEVGEIRVEGVEASEPVLKKENPNKQAFKLSQHQVLFQNEEVPNLRSCVEEKPLTTPPIQSKQEEIKQQLEAKINEGAPTGIEATPKKIFEHKVKNLYTIFSELKYQKIDEILHNTSKNNQDKIDEVKKFQNKFKLDLPINNNDELERTLNHLNSDIATENLSYDTTTLSTKKFIPDSYTQEKLQNHLMHSKHYLDGILKDDGINAEKRIEAAKLFVKQLELVSEPDNSNMANVHKQFVQYQADESSGDSKKIVAEGVEFAKSISRDSTTSFLGADGKVSNPSHFHNSVVEPEVDQRNLVIRKFTERLSELSSALKSEAIIDKAKTNEIFEKTKITYTIDLKTRKITFKDPNPPVVAGGAGVGAGAPAADAAAAGAAGADTPAFAPANPFTNISFVGLSNEDIFRRSLYLRYATEGIMEAEGNDADKEKAINFLIHEMKITTQTQFAHQNASYGNHIKINTEFSNSQEENQKINNLKNIGAELLRRVANEKTETVLMSNHAMEVIYANAGLSLKTPIIDDNSMSIKTTIGAQDIRKYIKAVQEFQEKEIKEILENTSGAYAEKKQKIEAILNLSLTYDEDSSQLKIKTTRGNLKKIETLKGKVKDDDKHLREDSRLMQSYFSNLYKEALTTENVDDDQKILGLKAINAINSVANFDRSFMDFKKIKKQNTKDSAIATDIAITQAVKDAVIASGKAITQAVKAESFDEKGDLNTDFSWKDASETDKEIIDQTKLKTSYDKYLKSREAGDGEEIKSGSKFWSCLSSFSRCFGCSRLEETKELTEEQKRSNFMIKEFEGMNLSTIDRDNRLIYRFKLTAITDILNNAQQPHDDKIKLLGELNKIESSQDKFIAAFSKNLNLKFPSTKQDLLTNKFNVNPKNYLEKFCKFVLESKKTDEQKIKALDIFIKELNAEANTKTLNGIIGKNENDADIEARVNTLLDKVERKEENIFAHEELNPAPAPAPVIVSALTPPAAAARPTPDPAPAAAAATTPATAATTPATAATTAVRT